jgi:hypothetical protein
VYVASVSDHFAPNEFLIQCDQEYLDWIKNHRSEATTSRPDKRIIDRQLFNAVSEITDRPDGHALLRQILGFYILDETKKLARSIYKSHEEILAEVKEAPEFIKGQINTELNRFRVRDALLALATVSGEKSALRLLKKAGAYGLTMLAPEKFEQVEEAAWRATINDTCNRIEKVAGKPAAIAAFKTASRGIPFAKLTLFQLGAVAERLCELAPRKPR